MRQIALERDENRVSGGKELAAAIAIAQLPMHEYPIVSLPVPVMVNELPEACTTFVAAAAVRSCAVQL